MRVGLWSRNPRPLRNTADLATLENSLKGINEQTTALHNGLTPEAIAYQLNIGGVRDATDAVKATLEKQISELKNTNETSSHAQSERIDALKSALAPKLDSISAGVRIPPNVPDVNVYNTTRVSVSAAAVARVVTITNRYGSPGGSYAGKKIPI